MENTCVILTEGLHTIAYYSHLVPTVLALLLGLYALLKTKCSKLSVIFLLFVVSFSAWLVGDLFLWTQPNYYFINFFWSWLDYINVVFFALGAYFFVSLSRGKISNFEKTFIFFVSVPAAVITVWGISITGFDQTYCESLENNLLTNYKLFAEGVYVLWMLVSLFMSWRKSDKSKKVGLVVVLAAILLFFGVFSSTEYVATVTNIYEINLYGLFILPLFLIAMTFAITNLGVFQVRFLGTQLLAYILIIMAGSQLLFLKNTTDLTLNLITLAISVFIAMLLVRNTGKEEEARIQIEQLAKGLAESNDKLGAANAKLKALDKQKTEFVSMASHQLRSPLTAIKGYSSMLLEGSFGTLGDKTKDAVSVVFQSSQKLVMVIEDFLNITRIELGTMKYTFSELDLAKVAKTVVNELKMTIESKGLKIAFNAEPGEFKVKADLGKISQVMGNIIDNSSKYTPKGSIDVSVKRVGDKIHFETVDTGVGIDPGVMPKLFQKFMRADDAGRVNISGTGQGLYVAKQLIEGQGGKIWAESAGKNQGAKFIVELPAAK